MRLITVCLYWSVLVLYPPTPNNRIGWPNGHFAASTVNAKRLVPHERLITNTTLAAALVRRTSSREELCVPQEPGHHARATARVYTTSTVYCTVRVVYWLTRSVCSEVEAAAGVHFARQRKSLIRCSFVLVKMISRSGGEPCAAAPDIPLYSSLVHVIVMYMYERPV
jgi:hypothetical protein